MKELDVRELFEMMQKRWWIILLTAIIAVTASAVYSAFFIVPVYEADTSLYVGRNLESEAKLEYSDLILANILASDYREFIKSRFVTGLVIQNLKLPMTPQSLADKLRVEPGNGTRFLRISFQDKDPRLAMDIANEVAKVFRDEVTKMMHVKNVQIIDTALLPQSPVKSGTRKNIALSLVLGMMLGASMVIFLDYLNNSIVTPEDIQKHMGIPVLGTIPVFSGVARDIPSRHHSFYQR